MAQICGWLGAEKIVENGGFNIVMEGLSRRTDGAGYRRATEETLEILKWIRQLADAIKKKPNRPGTEGKPHGNPRSSKLHSPGNHRIHAGTPGSGCFFQTESSQLGDSISDNKKEAVDHAAKLNQTDKRNIKNLIDRQAILAGLCQDQALKLDVKSVAPFVTGMVIEHPLENGFAF